MRANEVIFPGAAGTSLMTVFSYIVSESKGKNFKEPELLAALLKGIFPNTTGKLFLPAGWMIHYSMGISWTLVIKWMMQYFKMKSGLKAGIALGALSGLTGVLIWRLAFRKNSNPPRIDFSGFYGQLLLAHLIFSITVTTLRAPTPTVSLFQNSSAHIL